jgi:hypothetical protein
MEKAVVTVTQFNTNPAHPLLEKNGAVRESLHCRMDGFSLGTFPSLTRKVACDEKCQATESPYRPGLEHAVVSQHQVAALSLG